MDMTKNEVIANLRKINHDAGLLIIAQENTIARQKNQLGDYAEDNMELRQQIFNLKELLRHTKLD
jgi:hypothetical protein